MKRRLNVGWAQGARGNMIPQIVIETHRERCDKNSVFMLNVFCSHGQQLKIKLAR